MRRRASGSRSSIEQLRSRWPLVVVVLLTATAFGCRLWALLACAEPPGTDGYYYAVQVRSLLEDGHLHVREGSWALYALASFSWALGDVIVGLKVGAAAFAAACVPGAAAVGWVLVDDERRERVSVVLAAWACASPSLSYLCAHHPKNLVAVCALLAGVGLVGRAGRRRWAGVVLLLLAAMGHKLVAVLVLLGVGVAVLVLGLRRARAAWAVVVGVLLFALAGAVLPNLLHPSDLERLDDQVGSLREGLMPVLFFGRSLPAVLLVEVGLCWAGLGVGLWGFRSDKRWLTVPALLALVVILVVPWRGDVLDLGWRLALVAPTLAMVLVGPRLAFVARPFAGGALVLVLLTTGQVIEPHAHPPYDEHRARLARIPRPLPSLVIAHQGFNFLYDWETRHDAMAWAPEAELDPRRVGRVVYGLTPPDVVDFNVDVGRTGERAAVSLGGLYAFMTEEAWRELLVWADEQGDPVLMGLLADVRNPRRVRPWMLARNRSR